LRREEELERSLEGPGDFFLVFLRLEEGELFCLAFIVSIRLARAAALIAFEMLLAERTGIDMWFGRLRIGIAI
jgi:hypothetical protein